MSALAVLPADQKAAYAAITKALADGAIGEELDPFDVDRVVRDVLLFAAINSDQLPS